MKTNEVTNGNSPKLKIALIAGSVIIVLIAFGIGAVVANAKTLDFFPKQFYIADVDVSGKTPAAARATLDERANQIQRLGIHVNSAKNGSHVLPLDVGGQKILIIDVDATLTRATRAAGSEILWHKLKDLLGISTATYVDEVVVENEDSAALLEKVVAAWNLDLHKPTNAYFEISAQGADIAVIAGVQGERVLVDKLLQDAREALSHNTTNVELSIETGDPEITTEVAESLVPKAKSVAGEITRGRTLTIGGTAVPVSSTTLVSLLQPHIVDSEAVVNIDAEGLKRLLGTQLTQFEHSPSNGEFERQGNKATKFVPSRNGVSIDWGVTANNLYSSLATTSTALAVATKETEPEVHIGSANELGIKEILGVGISDFANSPKNRIHNISVGMNSVNGTLIAPGETFSLMKTLGRIDQTTGYLQELVIKENKTIPEYGGGLCQIGTTTFRAAMAAGFQIVERQNHSYAVGYYFEDGLPGTDATIYDPKPDFRFLNDTGHWTLIQTEMKGNKLYFTVWGTNDGRVAARTVPKILARQPAPARKVIETTDLPPGKVKCTERAHAGVTAIFTYSVKYADGTIKKQDFQSYYKPWGEVCLQGVEATASSTPTGVDVTIPPIVLPTQDNLGTTGT